MKKFIFFTVIFISIAFLTVSATIINVPDDYPTIQEGINASSDGDTVLVDEGIYVENVNFYGHNITLGSLFLTTGDTLYISSTIIDGDSSGTVVAFENGEDSTTVIIGFTIQNGNATTGGGISCLWNSDPKIFNNIIGNNSSHGIYNRSSNPTISDNNIRENSQRGIYCQDNSSPAINNNIINGNNGGGICCTYTSTPMIYDNIINGNSTIGFYSTGAGIYCGWNSNCTINNNTISGNSADYFGGGIWCGESSPMIIDNYIGENCAVWGGGIYCNRNSNPVIKNNMISRNYVSEGGGVYCNDSNPIMNFNLISENIAAGWGGGVLCENNSNPTIINNIINGNIARGFGLDSWGIGGGIYFTESDPIIINSTISCNSADSIGGGIYCYNSNPIIINTIFWADSVSGGYNEIYILNSSLIIIYSNIQGGWEGEGNIDVDPLFRDPDNNDFHLMATYCGDPYDSPCIDAGHPEIIDILLDCFHGLGTQRADMGAYGGNNTDWPVGIEEDENYVAVIPKDFLLYQNYPNPFNASTVIRYSLTVKSDIRLDIYNILGQRVATLFEGIQEAGEQSIIWNAVNLPSGIYFARLESIEYSETIKMVLLK